jgi:threonine/homoserine/homoserine lactone efflux protein
MIEALFHGIIWGLILCVTIGPVFFFLIQTSIKEGLKQAMLLDIGIVGSDAFCLLLAYLGTASIFNNPQYKILVGLIGGVILIGFGLVPFLAKRKKNNPEDEVWPTKRSKPLTLIIKGFLLNTTNPFVFLFWIGYVGAAILQFKNNTAQLAAYATGTFSIIILTDFLKAYLANKIKSRINPSMLVKINKVSGALIFIFGIILIVRVLYLD